VLSVHLALVDDPATGERWVQDAATGDWFVVDFERIRDLYTSGALVDRDPLERALVSYLCAQPEFAC
jgi:hypothetical protein